MAGATKQEYPPLLPVGFHEMDLTAVRRLCVARFPDSITRNSIMEKLEEVLSLIQQNGMRGEVWIDGSFTTEKLNPDDVDLILVTEAKDHQSFDDDQRNFFKWFSETSLYDRFRCDNYTMIKDASHPKNEWTLAYWLRQFGFSRGNQMKGLAVVKLPFLVRS
jgi:hypothetical protein